MEKSLFLRPEHLSEIKKFLILTVKKSDETEPLPDFEKAVKYFEYYSYPFFKKDVGDEKILIVFNFDFDDGRDRARKYGFRSFVFGRIEDGKLSLEFREKHLKSNGYRQKPKYKFQKTEKTEPFDVFSDDAEEKYGNFAEKIGLCVSFEIFRAAADYVLEAWEKRKEKGDLSAKEVDRFIGEAADEKIAEKYRYFARMRLNGQYFNRG